MNSKSPEAVFFERKYIILIAAFSREESFRPSGGSTWTIQRQAKDAWLILAAEWEYSNTLQHLKPQTF